MSASFSALPQLDLGFGSVAVAIEMFLAGPAGRAKEQEATEKRRKDEQEATHRERART